MKKQLLIATLSLASLTTSVIGLAAEAPVNVSLGVSLQPARWQGENKNGGSDFDANASQLQLNLRIRKEKLYGGLSFQGADFDFENGAPDKVSDTALVTDDNTTIKRGEFDLVFGYYFWPRISLFVDIKSITNDWQDTNYSTRYGGLGFGVSGFTPVNKDWLFFGSLGVVNLNIKTGGTDIGDGRGSALALGFLYRITPKNNFTISIKSQHNEYTFDQGAEQVHDIGGLVFGFSHII